MSGGYSGVKALHADKVFGYLDLDVSFGRRVNVIYGPNGSGKTTMLHILANLSEMQLTKFFNLEFATIRVEYYDGVSLRLRKTETADSLEIHVEDAKDGLLAEYSIAKGDVATAAKIDDGKEDESNRGSVAAPWEKKWSGPPSVAYFPAFRTTMEGLAINLRAFDERLPRTRRYLVTNRAARQRMIEKFLGAFMPKVDFVTPVEITDELEKELFFAERTVNLATQNTFITTFEEAIAAILDGHLADSSPEDLLTQIREVLAQTAHADTGNQVQGYSAQFRSIAEKISKPPNASISNDLSGVLAVYLEAFKRYQETVDQAYKIANEFKQAVGEFLKNGKQLDFNMEDGRYGRSIRVKLPNGDYSPLSVLSSGEREIISMLYAATHLSRYQTVLIDEPELSLHVDWQRILLKKMASLAGDKQIIACTHSPQIGADFEMLFALEDSKFFIYGTD